MLYGSILIQKVNLIFINASMTVEDDYELQRSDITLVRQLGIGEYGPIYDAEVKVKKNRMTRALVKVPRYMHISGEAICRYGCKIWFINLQVFQKGTNQNLVDFSKDNDVLK